MLPILRPIVDLLREKGLAYRLLVVGLWAAILRYVLLAVQSTAPGLSVLGLVNICIFHAAMVFLFAVCAWPLTSYRLAILVASFGSAVSIGFSSVPVHAMEMWDSMPLYAILLWVLVPATVYGLTMCGLMCLLVWFRRYFRPVYPPGHCASCGYCQEGLQSPRCPECGKPFE